MYESKNTEFKPAEGEMPETIGRFKLDEVKGKLKSFSDGNILKPYASILCLIGGITFLFLYTSQKEQISKDKKIHAQSAQVNNERTSIDITDVVDQEKSIVQAYTQSSESGGLIVLQPKMSKQEKQLSRLVPKVDLMNPDE